MKAGGVKGVREGGWMRKVIYCNGGLVKLLLLSSVVEHGYSASS